MTHRHFRHTQFRANKERNASSIQIMANHSTTSVADLLNLVAANLKAHMKERDMSMQALADASGVSKRTVVNFLGARKTEGDASGTMANFFKLAAALKVEPWELLCEPEYVRFHRSVEQAFAERVHPWPLKPR